MPEMRSDEEFSHDTPRTTVILQQDEESGRYYMLGTETSDRNRANVFGTWRDEPEDDGDMFHCGGRYFPARPNDEVEIEVEVTFSFFESEDIEDHAEVYWWQIYHWTLQDGAALCTADDMAKGDYVVEAGGLDGPFSIYSPLVSAAVDRIYQERWNKVTAPARVVGGSCSLGGWYASLRRCASGRKIEHDADQLCHESGLDDPPAISAVRGVRIIASKVKSVYRPILPCWRLFLHLTHCELDALISLRVNILGQLPENCDITQYRSLIGYAKAPLLRNRAVGNTRNITENRPILLK